MKMTGPQIEERLRKLEAQLRGKANQVANIQQLDGYHEGEADGLIAAADEIELIRDAINGSAVDPICVDCAETVDKDSIEDWDGPILCERCRSRIEAENKIEVAYVTAVELLEKIDRNRNVTSWVERERPLLDYLRAGEDAARLQDKIVEYRGRLPQNRPIERS
jgi:DNA-directed RNA polymerase subunit RPC12/RpoP